MEYSITIVDILFFIAFVVAAVVLIAIILKMPADTSRAESKKYSPMVGELSQHVKKFIQDIEQKRESNGK